MAPSGTASEFQANEYGELKSMAARTQSTAKSTRVTEKLSLAAAVTVTTCETGCRRALWMRRAYRGGRHRIRFRERVENWKSGETVEVAGR